MQQTKQKPHKLLVAVSLEKKDNGLLIQRPVCLLKASFSTFTYGDVFVLDEQAVEEPDDGADGEEEGEPEGHELHALGPDHLPLLYIEKKTI